MGYTTINNNEGEKNPKNTPLPILSYSVVIGNIFLDEPRYSINSCVC